MSLPVFRRKDYSPKGLRETSKEGKSKIRSKSISDPGIDVDLKRYRIRGFTGER